MAPATAAATAIKSGAMATTKVDFAALHAINSSERCDFKRVPYHTFSMRQRKSLHDLGLVRSPIIITNVTRRWRRNNNNRELPTTFEAFDKLFGGMPAFRTAAGLVSLQSTQMLTRGLQSVAVRLADSNVKQNPTLWPLQTQLEQIAPLREWSLAHGFGPKRGALIPILSAGHSGQGVHTHRHAASYHAQIHGKRFFQLLAPSHWKEEAHRRVPMPCAELLPPPTAQEVAAALRVDATWAQAATSSGVASRGLCVLRPGDVLLLGEMWWHSVCHLTSFSWGTSLLDSNQYK